jgi:protein-tyrosine phosphatase/CheY-like chemotaxis protein
MDYSNSRIERSVLMFYFRHLNRLVYPQKHILICEDDLSLQHSILKHFLEIFEPQGLVQFSVVPGGLFAAGIMSQQKVDVILLDHDMPHGSGSDLLAWMKENNDTTPVITFSGIPQNNQNMMALGATHLFGKGEVIDGKADSLIKQILGLTISKKGLAETYTNTISPNKPICSRFWVDDKLMVGGNICNLEDLNHLKNDFGIEAIINVDGLQNHTGAIDHLLQFHVNDDGDAFPPDKIKRLIQFAELHKDKRIYVHCHMGRSRSAHMAYAILRAVRGLSKDRAYEELLSAMPEDVKPWFGRHSVAYVNSIEDAINNLDTIEMNVGIAEFYVNKVCINTPTSRRYWLTPKLMVGGSICDYQDWLHIKKDYQIGAVVNMETEHSDVGKGVDYLCEVQVPDNGTPFPKEYIQRTVLFAKKHFDKNLYVHCQMGGSRSPAFAYAILRYCYNMTPQEALDKINEQFPKAKINGEGLYGFHPYHKTYLASVENALNDLEKQGIE